MATAIHHHQALRSIEHQALFMRKIVMMISAVFLDTQMCHLANRFKPLRLVRHEVDIRSNASIPFCKTDTVGKIVKKTPAYPNILMIGNTTENFVCVVTVFGSSCTQIERCGPVYREKGDHPARMIVVRMAQDSRINKREVHTHGSRISYKQGARPRIQENPQALEFHMDAQPPFTANFGPIFGISFNIIDKNLYYHSKKILFSPFYTLSYGQHVNKKNIPRRAFRYIIC